MHVSYIKNIAQKTYANMHTYIYVYIYKYAGAAAFRGGAAIAVIGQPRMPELTGPYTTVGVRVVRIPFADTEVGKGGDGGGEEEKGGRGQSCRAKIFYPAAAGGGAAETPAAYCTDGRQTSDGVYHDVLKRALYTLKREVRYSQKSPVYTQKSPVWTQKSPVYTYKSTAQCKLKRGRSYIYLKERCVYSKERTLHIQFRHNGVTRVSTTGSFVCPPAHMHLVKYLRAGPAEMPFRNWYTTNTNHFHLTYSVRWK